MHFPVMANAGPLERLVMPGPVIKGHAKFENECSKCHSLFEKRGQNKLCLDCHKEVAKDIVQKKGFHGIKKDLAKKECKNCHTDHEGRGADIIQLVEETFDHRLTDFPLKGGHKAVKCYDCHAAEKKYRDTSLDCYSCHKSDDPHFERLGKKCLDCHNEQAWSKARFDHGKKTKFSLKGKHRDLKCNGCHPNERYKKTPKTCVGCHALNDVHRGELGGKCETCHTPKKWKTVSFDHDKDTKFALKESHSKLKCRNCHKGNPAKEKLKTQCVFCHKNDDEHKGGFGLKCEKCHNSSVWKKIHFDHNKDTKFKLVDRHAKLQCKNCHKGIPEKEKLGTQCYDCHKVDDVHKGQEGKKCDKCHNQRTWTTNVKFDHNKTRFPLIGLHAITTCEQCHLSPEFKDVGSECVDCHVNDDIHKSRLGPECGFCHSVEGWSSWKFEHNRQTDFILKGSHKEVSCHLCHTQPIDKAIKLPKTCYGCHKADDVHNGQEGENCAKCHNETAWSKDIQFNHDLTRFPLLGMHAVATCEDCHLSAEFKEAKTNCIHCHAKDDIHKARLGNECKLCHNPNHWNLWKFDHNTQTKFKLDGSHEGMDCQACHTREVKDKVELPKLCSGCHQGDDIHRGKFGNQCERCHTTETFKEINIRR
jgi:Cytochrome c7 and related cytochrome c